MRRRRCYLVLQGCPQFLQPGHHFASRRQRLGHERVGSVLRLLHHRRRLSSGRGQIALGLQAGRVDQTCGVDGGPRSQLRHRVPLRRCLPSGLVDEELRLGLRLGPRRLDILLRPPADVGARFRGRLQDPRHLVTHALEGETTLGAVDLRARLQLLAASFSLLRFARGALGVPPCSLGLGQTGTQLLHSRSSRSWRSRNDSTAVRANETRSASSPTKVSTSAGS